MAAAFRKIPGLSGGGPRRLLSDGRSLPENQSGPDGAPGGVAEVVRQSISVSPKPGRARTPLRAADWILAVSLLPFITANTPQSTSNPGLSGPSGREPRPPWVL